VPFGLVFHDLSCAEERIVLYVIHLTLIKLDAALLKQPKVVHEVGHSLHVVGVVLSKLVCLRLNFLRVAVLNESLLAEACPDQSVQVLQLLLLPLNLPRVLPSACYLAQFLALLLAHFVDELADLVLDNWLGLRVINKGLVVTDFALLLLLLPQLILCF
jgi:hypothetical protein